jgi:hypothetical protein
MKFPGYSGPMVEPTGSGQAGMCVPTKADFDRYPLQTMSALYGCRQNSRLAALRATCSRCPLRRRSLAGSSGSDSQELRPTHPSKLLRSITTRPLCGSGWALAPQPGPAPQSSRWPSERDSGHHAYPNRCPRLMPSAKSQHDWPQPLRRLSNQGLSGDAA